MKKTLSVILCAVMLLSVFSVVAFCAPSNSTINGTSYFVVPSGYQIDPNHFSIKFLYNTDKLVDLSGTVAPEECITNVITDATFEGRSLNSGIAPFVQAINNADEATGLESLTETTKGKLVQVPYTIYVANNNVIGSVDYTIVVTGFYKGELSESSTFINTTTRNTAVIDEIASAEITVVNAETTYKDNDTFKINEAVANVVSKNGITGVIKYSKTPAFFTASPVGAEKLTVNTTAVDVTVNATVCEPFTVNVTVDHAWGTKVASIGKTHHATVCEGCGEVDVATKAEHNFGTATYNEDATFFSDGTQSSVCADCGAIHTEPVDGTAGYCTKFANYKFLYVICNYVSLIFDFITGVKLTQG